MINKESIMVDYFKEAFFYQWPWPMSPDQEILRPIADNAL
jgi:hypothetical protein